jgi:hypothetical protein
MSFRRKSAGDGMIVCTISKDRRLYTYIIRGGKKVRVNNSHAIECGNIKACKISSGICSKKGPKKLPCKVRQHVFDSRKDVRDYCALKKARPKGEYDRTKRKRIARRATKSLEKEKARKSKRKTKRKIKFVL